MADLEQFGGKYISDVSSWVSGLNRANASIFDNVKAAQASARAVTEMGVRWDATARRFRTASGQFTSTRDALNRIGAATTGVARIIERFAQTGKVSERTLQRIQTAADKYAKSQINLASAERKAQEAIKKASTGTKDQEANLSKARDAIDRYQKASIDAGAAQRDLAAATAQANQEIQQNTPSFESATEGLLGFIENVRGTISQFVSIAGTILTPVANAIGGAINLIGRAFSALTAPIRNAVEGIKRFFAVAAQIAVGVLIRDTIRSIIRELRDLVGGAIEAAKAFQTLTLRLENFENRLLRSVDQTLTFEGAMGQASLRAQGLVEHIKNLSLTAPFSVEAIANTVSLNLAMGFTERQTLSLTDAILNFTAGMGLGNEIMERIVFNFGQMKAAGKVTGTELRDLARGAFLPINDVLEEAARLTGVAANGLLEFKAAAAEGRIGIDTFFTAFQNVVARDFPDALTRFSNTLEGVQIRLGNFFKTIVGLEILGPIFNRIAESANAALNNLLTPAVQRAAHILGIVLERAFGFVSNRIHFDLIPALKNLAAAFGIGIPTANQLAVTVAAVILTIGKLIGIAGKAINSFATGSAQTLGSLAGRAFRWGFNIAFQLARGIIAAAVFVVQAITAIARIISGLLQASSPPKILPDLPEWGAAAFTEYLKGFSEADFDVLNAVQGPLESALNILVATGKISEEQFGKLFVGLSEGLTKVLSGDLSFDRFAAQVMDALGPLDVIGEQIIQLAKDQLQLKAAIEAVNIAEQKLERARKSREAAQVQANKLVRAYNAAIRAGADPALLKGKLDQINAQESAALAALKEEQAAQNQLDAAKEQLKIWQEQVKLQQQLVEQLIKLTEAQIVQPEQPEEPPDGGDGGGGGGGTEEPPFEEPLPPTFEDIFGELPIPDFGGIEAELDDIFADAQKLSDEWVAAIEGAFEELDLGTLLDEFGNLLDVLDELTGLFDDAGLGAARMDGEIAGVTEKIDIFRARMGTLGSVVGNTVNVALGTFLATLDTIGDILGKDEGFDALTIALEALEIPLNFLSVNFAAFGQLVSGVLGGITAGVAAFTETWEEGGSLLEATWNAITAFFEGFVDGIILFAQNLKERLVGNSIIPEMMQAIQDVVEDKLNAVKTFFEDIWNGIVSFLQNQIVGPIEDFVNNTLESIRSFFAVDLTNAINTFKDSVLTPLKNYISDTLTNAWNTFKDNVLKPVSDFFTDTISKAITDFVDGPLSDLKDTIATAITNALNTFRTNVLDPMRAGFDSISTAVSAVIGWVDKLIQKIAQIDISKLNPFKGDSPAPLAVGINSITDALKGLNAQMPTMTGFSAGMGRVAMQPVSMAGAAGNSVSVNMGGVQITNAMSEAVFEQRVLNVVRKALG